VEPARLNLVTEEGILRSENRKTVQLLQSPLENSGLVLIILELLQLELVFLRLEQAKSLHKRVLSKKHIGLKLLELPFILIDRKFIVNHEGILTWHHHVLV